MSETAKLATFAATITYDALPVEVAERAKFLIMDIVGNTLRARHDAESTPALIAASKALGYAVGTSRVIGSSETYTPPAAAEGGDEEGGKQKKKRKKRDPLAPKGKKTVR